MAKTQRSSAPLALSVAAVTRPGNVTATLDGIIEFDDAAIGFTHSPTWGALPVALRGVISSTSSSLVFAGTHPRVEACIRALCELGERRPVEARRFADFPESGLRQVNDIQWGPGVVIKVKGVCWFVRGDTPIIPLLQPRKAGLEAEAMALYMALGRQAFCKGDWYLAQAEIVDLAGDIATATVLSESDIGTLSPTRVNEFIQTYVEAKKLADVIRAAKPKKPPKDKGDDLFGKLPR